jgi:hypothetical protein
MQGPEDYPLPSGMHMMLTNKNGGNYIMARPIHSSPRLELEMLFVPQSVMGNISKEEWHHNTVYQQPLSPRLKRSYMSTNVFYQTRRSRGYKRLNIRSWGLPVLAAGPLTNLRQIYSVCSLFGAAVSVTWELPRLAMLLYWIESK